MAPDGKYLIVYVVPMKLPKQLLGGGLVFSLFDLERRHAIELLMKKEEIAEMQKSMRKNDANYAL